MNTLALILTLWGTPVVTNEADKTVVEFEDKMIVVLDSTSKITEIYTLGDEDWIRHKGV
jgi:hypothetical protein